MRRRLAVLIVLVLVLLAAPARAQRYSFVVTGDGRSDRSPRPGMDGNGINQTVMKELVTEILRVRPRFVLFTGDLVLGAKHRKDDELRSQLRAWLDLMKPVYEAGTRVYPVRGNHDTTSDNAAKVWNEVFSGAYALPDNGPAGEKGLTFTSREENALVIGLDEWGANPHAVNTSWLSEQLDRNDLPLVLVMAHEMAFRSGSHRDNLENDVAARDAFFQTLLKARATYFAGHDHFYDHQIIRNPKDPDAGKVEIHQFVAGTAGAPFYQGQDYGGNNGPWMVAHGKHIELTYGYLLGIVDGADVSLFFMGRVAPGVYEPLDSVQPGTARPSKP